MSQAERKDRSPIIRHASALLTVLLIYSLTMPFVLWLFFTLMRMLGLVEGVPW